MGIKRVPLLVAMILTVTACSNSTNSGIPTRVPTRTRIPGSATATFRPATAIPTRGDATVTPTSVAATPSVTVVLPTTTPATGTATATPTATPTATATRSGGEFAYLISMGAEITTYR